MIEVALVIVIVGVMTGGVMLTLLPKLKTSSTAEAMRRLIDCDARARTLARTTREPVELAIDPYAGTIAMKRTDEAARELLRLPGRLSLSDVVTRDGPQSGRFVIRYGDEGRSESYAIGVTDEPRVTRWVLFAGLTGMTTQNMEGRQVEAIFEQLRSPRTDAH